MHDKICPQDSVISVASYNIHGCVGVDGRLDPARIASVIQEIDVPLIGLQEVHFGTVTQKDSCQMQLLVSATQMDAVAGPTRVSGDFQYGNMLLTRFPIVKSRLLDLSVSGREPRGAIAATVLAEGTEINVIVTHLGLRSPERRAQIRKLLEAADAPHPTLILGDLNEWIPLSRSIRWLYRHFGKTPAPKTFPSFFPLLPLDRVWSFPQNTLIRSSAFTSVLARVASDHLPVKALIRVA